MSASKAPAGHFTLLYFASAKSYTGKTHEFLPAPLAVDKLFTALDKMYPGIREKVLSSSAVTVNLDYVEVQDDTAADESDGLVIQAGDEVAIIPPVSSG